MPEGDTLYRIAVRARELFLAQLVVEFHSSTPAVDGALLVGSRIQKCSSRGKHLLMEFDNGFVLHTHLGMNGRWRFAEGRRSLPVHRGPNRIMIHSDSATGWCFGAPVMELLRITDVQRYPILSALGMDVLDPDFRVAAVIDQFRSIRSVAPIGEALLDQRCCAGIGNVYKCEGLFLQGIHPMTSVVELSNESLGLLLLEIRKWMFRNLGSGRRGTRWPGRGRHWVYERAGERCLRCDGTIDRMMIGTPPRVTFFCPACQS